MALSIDDLNKGEQNTDFIERFANSEEETTTDRLGRTRRTIAGVEAYIDDHGILGQTIDARNEAVDAANAAVSGVGLPEFSSDAAGIAGVADGEMYIILAGNDGYTRTTTRKRVGSGAITVVDPVSGSEFDALLPAVTATSQIVPLFADDSGNIPATLVDGKLDVSRGLAAPLMSKIAADLPQLPVAVAARSEAIPFAADDSDKVPLWFINGLMGVKGFTPQLLASVVSSVTAGLRYAPLASPIASARPAMTDGRSLYAWRAKLATLIRSSTGRARVLMTGDSWTDLTTIPQALANLLYTAYGKSGDGWISVGGQAGNFMMNGLTFARSGWTSYDASETAVAPAHGTGIDGNSLSTSGAAATLSIGNCVATEFSIYYRQTTGTFRWRIDGGVWTAVTGDGSGTLGIANITGLSNAAHLLEIDTTGNTGTAVLQGFRATRAAVPGIELHKCGNGNIDSSQIPKFMDQIAPLAVQLAPDVVIVILGTNDYRRGDSTPNVYIATIDALVAAYRSVLPNVGFIFVAPADTNGVAVTPLTAYRDALYEFCVQAGHEFYNMNELWGSYAVMNGMGMFDDSLHTNANGGHLTASGLNTGFLTLK